MLEVKDTGGYTIDCKYVIRVKDYMSFNSFPVILVDSGEDS